MIAKLGISGAFSVVCLYTPEVFPTTLRFPSQLHVQFFSDVTVCSCQQDHKDLDQDQGNVHAIVVNNTKQKTTANCKIQIFSENVSFRLFTPVPTSSSSSRHIITYLGS